MVSPKPEFFTLAQCYDFLSHTDCLACYFESRKKLLKCSPEQSARIYLDGCFFRYDNYSFFSEAVDEERDTVKCASPKGVWKEKYIGKEFAKVVDQVIMNVTEMAVRNEGFAVAGLRGGDAVYAMAQCWMTVDAKSCKTCLLNAGTKIRKCAPAREGRVMNAGCYLRYSNEKFFSNGGVSESESRKNKQLSNCTCFELHLFFELIFSDAVTLFLCG